MIYFSDENMQKKQTNVHRRIFLVQDISTHFKTGSSKCWIFCLHWNRKKSLECTEAFSTFFNKAMAMSHYVPTTESASCSAVRLRGHRRKIMDVHPAKHIRYHISINQMHQVIMKDCLTLYVSHIVGQQFNALQWLQHSRSICHHCGSTQFDMPRSRYATNKEAGLKRPASSYALFCRWLAKVGVDVNPRRVRHRINGKRHCNSAKSAQALW